MSVIKSVLISSIDPNPWRNLTKHPYNKEKLKTLQRSIDQVGFWEGVIARKVGGRYQLAFGHHRVEAARRLKLSRVDIIVRELSDREMVGFMGRENLEEYMSNFLTMMNAWEGARDFLKGDAVDYKPQVIEIARVLGWLRPEDENKSNETGLTCSAVHQLVESTDLNLMDFRALATKPVRVAARKVKSRIKQVELEKKRNPRINLERRKAAIVGACKAVLDGVRAGEPMNRLATEIDRLAGLKDGQLADLDKYLDTTVGLLAKVGKSDSIATRTAYLAKDFRAKRTQDEFTDETWEKIAKLSDQLVVAAANILDVKAKFDRVFKITESNVIDIETARKALGAG